MSFAGNRSALHRRRDVLRLLIGVPTAAVLAGCGQARPAATGGAPPLAGQTVTVRYDSYNFGAPGIGGKGTQQLIDEFQALYPNITIQGRNVASDRHSQVNDGPGSRRRWSRGSTGVKPSRGCRLRTCSSTPSRTSSTAARMRNRRWTPPRAE